MKFSEIIDVEKHFKSAYDITSDSGETWKTFITNDRFEKNLSSIIKCFDSSIPENKKSIWIQGTFGTGKSHSLAVIKHILSDDYSNITDYVSRINNSQLRSSILNFRKNKKAFCVVLKGIYDITDVADLKYTIQKEVISSLGDIELITKTDFQSLLQVVENEKFDSFFEQLIKENTELRSYTPNKQALIESLKNGETKVLRIVSDEMKKNGLDPVRAHNIVEWLIEVKNELQEKGIADYLTLIWDEFTMLLDIPARKSILTVMQNIAELSYKEVDNKGNTTGIYLLLVSHRKMEATETFRELKEDEKNMAQARFVQLDYGMQATTTYHIMSGALERKQPEVLDKLVQKNMLNVASVCGLLDTIVDNATINAADTKSKIVSLYPFHPYTAYLATFVSRAVGEAERSIFGFLNDEENGFKKYIQNDIDDTKFLTADYVWDFFYNTFEQNSNGHFDAITNKFKLMSETVAKQGTDYLAVFKTILLLNILYRVTTTDADSNERVMVNPSTQNIILAFSGVFDDNKINTILDYIDESQALHRNPDGVFEVSSSSLPQKKVLEEKRKLYSGKEDVAKIVEDYAVSLINRLKNALNDNVAREVDAKVFWGGDKEHLLKTKLIQKFTTTYTVNVAIVLYRGSTPDLEEILGRKETSKDESKSMFINLSKESVNKNTVFALVNTELGNKRFEAYLDNVAQEIVARSLQLTEEVTSAQQMAEKWITNWIEDILSTGSVELVFRGDSIHVPFKQINKYLKDNYIKAIFPMGLDYVPAPITAWKKQVSKKAVELVLFSPTKTDLENDGSGPDAVVKNLLSYDSTLLFNEQLELISNDTKIPLVKACKEVEKRIENKKNETSVNLAEELKFLSKPEYGYYTNRLFMGALGLALRPYINKLYATGKTTLINNTLMKDIVVAIFNNWENGKDGSDKYTVRASSEEERELNIMLRTVFGINGSDDEKGLIGTKWDIRDSFEKINQAPLWALKYVGENSDDYNSFIDNMFKFSKTTEDNIDQDFIALLLNGIKKYNIELSQALSEVKDEECLNHYIQKQLSAVQEDSSSLDSVKSYIKGQLSGNICYWEEDDVKQQILWWKINKANKTESNGDSNGDTQTSAGGSSGNSVDPINNDKLDELRKSVIERIEVSKNDTEKLYTVLLKLIEIKPSILEELDKLLQ